MSDDERTRWQARWAERAAVELPPAAWIVEHAKLLPARGRALDWAGGDGRHALWLAARGLDVTLADIAPNALATARARAAARGLDIECVELDLSRDPSPAGPFDLILCHHYLDRELPARALPHLAPGGLLLWVQPTRRNLERHDRPGERFLLEEGEMPRLLAAYEVVTLEEGWGSEGRHEARAIVRRT